MAARKVPDMRPDGSSSAQHITFLNKPRTTSAGNFETHVSTSLPKAHSASSVQTEELPKPPRRFKLNRAQTVALEKLYQQTRKPNQATKRELSQAIDLSLTRVNIWFQNRRHRAKVQQRAEELKQTQILETAGRDRLAKMALGHSLHPSIEVFDAQGLQNLSLELQDNSINYSSPKEAAAASLARSLAVAEAYASSFNPNGEQVLSEYHAPAGPFDGTPPQNYSLDPFDPNFYPVSAFSPWESNYSPALYTPTPAGQLEDPFEYDGPQYTSLAVTRANPMASVQPVFQDDYSAFAAAIQLNEVPKTFTMPAKEPVPVPNKFVLKTNASQQRPVLSRYLTCPELARASGIQSAMQPPASQLSKATRESRSPPTKSLAVVNMERSLSQTDRQTLQQELAMRRIRTSSAGNSPNMRAQRIFQGKLSVPESPLRLGQAAGAEYFKAASSQDRVAPLLTPPSDASFALSPQSKAGKSGSSPVEVTQLQGSKLASPPPTPEDADSDCETVSSVPATHATPQPQRLTNFTKILEADVNVDIVDDDGQPFLGDWLDFTQSEEPSLQYWTAGPSFDTSFDISEYSFGIPQASTLAFSVNDTQH